MHTSSHIKTHTDSFQQLFSCLSGGFRFINECKLWGQTATEDGFCRTRPCFSVVSTALTMGLQKAPVLDCGWLDSWSSSPDSAVRVCRDTELRLQLSERHVSDFRLQADLRVTVRLAPLFGSSSYTASLRAGQQTRVEKIQCHRRVWNVLRTIKVGTKSLQSLWIF